MWLSSLCEPFGLATAPPPRERGFVLVEAVALCGRGGGYRDARSAPTSKALEITTLRLYSELISLHYWPKTELAKSSVI